MAGDIIVEREHLFLGSRLKRLAERMQGDVARVVAASGLPIQPGQYPLLATLDLHGPLTVSEMVEALGVSQPGVTRNLSRLVALGLVETTRAHRDQRQKTMSLTEAGKAAIARSKREVWPQVENAVIDLCTGLSGSLFDQIAAIERALEQAPLDRRTIARQMGGLSIREFSDDLAGAFHDINAEWIEAMYRMEEADRDVLCNPRARIVDAGGTILFVEAADLGLIGTCALRKTGEAQFELTKMGVRESARGRKAGEFLLAAIIERARAMGAEKLYLLSNAKSAAAIHLYEKLGFVHDEGVMRDHGARYQRCDIAMLYRPDLAGRSHALAQPISASA
ncbi:GNAT family N-acetyltransferase [Sphingomonas oligophenolica]|uniref:GNAT family N-acetyltransferase n=1 Tax=Sphingomonas oligophenolica TaxID=301154 RepID=A0ABU9Y1X3_9SPHN